MRAHRPRHKAEWYLQRGVAVVWLLDPKTRSVAVIRDGDETTHGPGDRIAERPDLPGLSPRVADLFRQLDTP